MSSNELLRDNNIDVSKLEMGIERSESESKKGFFANFFYSPYGITLLQKIIAEIVGTYFIIFAGCGSVAVNKLYGGSVTFPGICVTWGLIVLVMIYSLGHISAHFNPAVTITLTLFGRFPCQYPWLEVPAYIISQLVGSLSASGTLKLLFDVTKKSYFGTLPVGSDAQSLVIEIIISFLLMFVICGVGDDRGIGHIGGVAVGMTILLNVLVAGPISGASMNPARSIGPAIVMHEGRSLWVYIVGPIVGTIAGAFVYNLLRFTNKPLSQLLSKTKLNA